MADERTGLLMLSNVYNSKEQKLESKRSWLYYDIESSTRIGGMES